MPVYSITEHDSNEADFFVHRAGCRCIRLIGVDHIEATNPAESAEKYMEMCYTDLDTELDFGVYKIMPCCEHI